MKKAKTYRHLTYSDRLVIERLYNSGCSYRAIAKRLERSVSTIHREVKRGLYTRLNGATWEYYTAYSATIADDDAVYQASAKGTEIKLGNNYQYANLISARILSGESPDAIVGDLRNQGQWTVCTTTLYRYIDLGYIPGVTNKNLFAKRKKRKYEQVRRAARAPKGVSIEHRPKHINRRKTFGHWEADLVIGKAEGHGEAVLTLVERKTRFQIIVKLPDKTASSIVSALQKTISQYPTQTFKTITVDNGSEFQDYEGMKQLVREVYYCHPYTSSERGSNENGNKLVRRFFPKGRSMSRRTQADCDAAARHINAMHRKLLGYRTAADLFQEELSKLAG